MRFEIFRQKNPKKKLVFGNSDAFVGLLERLPDGWELRAESSEATPLSVWCVLRRLDIARSKPPDQEIRGCTSSVAFNEGKIASLKPLKNCLN